MPREAHSWNCPALSFTHCPVESTWVSKGKEGFSPVHRLHLASGMKLEMVGGASGLSLRYKAGAEAVVTRSRMGITEWTVTAFWQDP